ncbi:MAG: hypothetical protein L0Y58_06440 [Verrucomicrobia subdivision 3 bacterium]|nr:hypothetical protein [Limisphaerales bacterium]
MQPLTDSNLSRARSIRLVAVSASVSAIGFPFAAASYAPTEIGCPAWWGVLMFSVMACCSIACFFLCPPRPRIWKLIALALTIPALFWTLSTWGDYWLHLIYHV